MPTVGGSSSIRRERRKALYEKQDGLCHWCRLKMTLEKTPGANPGPLYATFEHLIPRALGGDSGPANVVLAHSRCNEKRGLQAGKTYDAAMAAKLIGY